MFWYLIEILALKRLGLGRPFRFLILIVLLCCLVAAADAHYEMVGKAEPLVKFIVRTIIDGSGDYGLETWVGTPLELSATFRGTREEVALKFVIADKDMQLKGYSRRGHFVGNRAFSLS